MKLTQKIIGGAMAISAFALLSLVVSPSASASDNWSDCNKSDSQYDSRWMENSDKKWKDNDEDRAYDNQHEYLSNYHEDQNRGGDDQDKWKNKDWMDSQDRNDDSDSHGWEDQYDDKDNNSSYHNHVAVHSQQNATVSSYNLSYANSGGNQQHWLDDNNYLTTGAANALTLSSHVVNFSHVEVR